MMMIILHHDDRSTYHLIINYDKKMSIWVQAIAPLGWRVSASMDVAAKNLDSNDRFNDDDDKDNYDNDDHDDGRGR